MFGSLVDLDLYSNKHCCKLAARWFGFIAFQVEDKRTRQLSLAGRRKAFGSIYRDDPLRVTRRVERYVTCFC